MNILPSRELTSSPPPHPFRTSPWYDPERARIEAESEPLPRRSWWRIVVALAAGAVLPIASLAANEALEVIALGRLGVAAVLFAVGSAIAQLALVPVRRRPGRPGRRPPSPTDRWDVSAPTSTLLCVALLGAALLSCVIWGYLALLFAPLLPISLVLTFFGIGIFGLCPMFALGLAVIQAVRIGRQTLPRLGSKAAVLAVGLPLAVPPVAAAASAWQAQHARAHLTEALRAIARSAPYGSERMRLIDDLAGETDRIVRRYVDVPSGDQRRLLAEVYMRLTDRPIVESLRAHRRRFDSTVIDPWWFLYDFTHERAGVFSGFARGW